MPKVVEASGEVKSYTYTPKGRAELNKAAAASAAKKPGSKSVGSKKSYG